MLNQEDNCRASITCAKALAPTEVSWAEGCWCYQHQLDLTFALMGDGVDKSQAKTLIQTIVSWLEIELTRQQTLAGLDTESLGIVIERLAQE